MSRAYYSALIKNFNADSDDTIIAALTKSSSFAIEPSQRDAWQVQIGIMRTALANCSDDAFVAFELAVPRMGKRIDVVLVLGAVVYVLEFKVGEREFTADALNQVWDYALDMKNFHSASHQATIVPILVATAASDVHVRTDIKTDHDRVVRPLCATARTMRELLTAIDSRCKGQTINVGDWVASKYKPTPTIIEAARTLYGGHRVEEISRREAEAINLTLTSETIDQIIHSARSGRHKTICFVTGVPGAGKTLVGLDIATRHQDKASELYGVFLSGNGPLVRILCEALARDECKRLKSATEKMSLKEARRKVMAFIQNVHHFRDECIRCATEPPVEHVALFDEAQRAWNKEQTQSFMRRKKGQSNFAMSEPTFLISCMDRHRDWAVIVCLVGGGQEINTGEAGIGEWLQAVNADFPHWHVHLSPHLKDSEYTAGNALEVLTGHAHVHTHESLHLAVSMRSFRAEHVSAWVKAMLDIDRDAAQRAMHGFRLRYPIVLTRNLAKAKEWLQGRARGNERFGIVVSSQAHRLRPLAIDVRVDIDPVHWFLNPRNDVRSSYYLEDAATEFDVQGLELDWTCVVWDCDLRFSGAEWQHWNFKGNTWQRILASERQAFLRNAYRVLLTRARQGMVIVVPEGSPSDPSRLPAYYEGTFEYLTGIGVEVL